MFALLLIACINTTVCDTVRSPVIYRSEERCAISASILAGMMRGRHETVAEQTYLFQCAPLAGGKAQWVVVDSRGAKTAAGALPAVQPAQD